ncbi:MAG: hypothetical protein NVSMB57_03190 [Actinomycetota bacterium]
MSRGPFERKRRGGVEMHLGEAEAEILEQVVGEMTEQLSMPDRPAHLWRLFPPAYRDDVEAQQEYARFTADDLSAQRLTALEMVQTVLRRGHAKRGAWTTTLNDDEMAALLGVLNDARLAIGTRLDVTEETEEGGEEMDPPSFAHAVYRYLGWLQSFLVDDLLDQAP